MQFNESLVITKAYSYDMLVLHVDIIPLLYKPNSRNYPSALPCLGPVLPGAELSSLGM